MSSLLSHCAFFLRDNLVLSDHVDATGNKLYPQSFTIGELKAVLRTYVSRRTSTTTNSLIEALIASLEAQLFFYITTWKSVERATDDDICILLRCDVYEDQPESPRRKLSSPSASISGAATSFPENSGAGVSLITSYPAARRQDDTDSTCLPTGVIPSLSKCYSSTCDESDPCYSFSCPNRNRKKFTVRCYSNSCSSGYGCYSPTCPCRYANGPEAETDDQSTVISVEVRSPSPPSIDAAPGQPTPKSVYDLPKLILDEGVSQAPMSDVGQITALHSPFISPATTVSAYSFSSSLTSSSSLSPMSPFSSATWDPSSPIDISNNDTEIESMPMHPTFPPTVHLPRIYTQIPYLNSYPPESPSPFSNSPYARSPINLSTPISPNWEPLLLISMIGPSVTWVSQDRASLSTTPTPTSPHENIIPQNHISISHPSPRTYRPFSSILKSYMESNNDDGNDATPQHTEADLLSPTTPYSPYSPYYPSPYTQ